MLEAFHQIHIIKICVYRKTEGPQVLRPVAGIASFCNLITDKYFNTNLYKRQVLFANICHYLLYAYFYIIFPSLAPRSLSHILHFSGTFRHFFCQSIGRYSTEYTFFSIICVSCTYFPLKANCIHSIHAYHLYPILHPESEVPDNAAKHRRYIHPECTENDVWRTPIEVTLRNDDFEAAKAEVETIILSPKGEAVASQKSSIELPARDQKTIYCFSNHTFALFNASPCGYALWLSFSGPFSICGWSPPCSGFSTIRIHPECICRRVPSRHKPAWWHEKSTYRISPIDALINLLLFFYVPLQFIIKVFSGSCHDNNH